MPNEPSKMIRVPTPLIEAVKELSRLHRQGRTKAVLEGVEKLVTAIDSELDIDIDSVRESLSKVTERLERLESERSDSRQNIDIDSITQLISERLEKVEADIESIALTITDLNVRLSDLEGVGDIGYAVTPLSKLELLDDISADSETIADVGEQGDITDDSGTIAKPESPLLPQSPLTQSALAKRLGCSDKAIEKHRKQGSKEQFAIWSGERDPNSIAWTWEGSGGRGQPLRFVPAG
jgi:archaellum component FlaC